MPFHQVGSIYFFIFYFYILYIYSIAYSEDGCIYRKVFFPQKKKKKKKIVECYSRYRRNGIF